MKYNFNNLQKLCSNSYVNLESYCHCIILDIEKGTRNSWYTHQYPFLLFACAVFTLLLYLYLWCWLKLILHSLLLRFPGNSWCRRWRIRRGRTCLLFPSFRFLGNIWKIRRWNVIEHIRHSLMTHRFIKICHKILQKIVSCHHTMEIINAQTPIYIKKKPCNVREGKN